MIRYCLFLLLLLNSSPIFCTKSMAVSFPEGEISQHIATTMYMGGEQLSYKISWSGGIKIGELRMEVVRIEETGNLFELRAHVKDSGLFHFFYPVDDNFITQVLGVRRLPLSYKVIQKEGNDYNARRHTQYNQKTGEIRYQKNDNPPVDSTVTGVVHNEFSSFFFTRMMNLEKDNPVIVPTFADGKRHEVVVHTGDEERIRKTILGDVNVLPVTPIMKFKGLYDKDGDTVIWLTNDECRIPVRINSKILIGSLTAELVSYTNPHCGDQRKYHKRIPENLSQRQKLELGD